MLFKACEIPFKSLDFLSWLAKFVEMGLGVNAFGEDLVEFFLDAQLRRLEFGQVRDHDCVFIVRHNHLLEHGHVIGGELSKAVIHHAAKLAVTNPLALKHLVDVVFTLLEAIDYFFEVLDHEGLIAEKFLTFHERSDLVLLDFSALTLLQNSHRIKVVLAKEDNVKACLLKFRELE